MYRVVKFTPEGPSVELTFESVPDFRKTVEALTGSLGMTFETKVADRGRIGEDTLIAFAKEAHTRTDVSIVGTKFFPDDMHTKEIKTKSKATAQDREYVVHGEILPKNPKGKPTSVVVRVSLKEIREYLGTPGTGKLSDSSIAAVAVALYPAEFKDVFRITEVGVVVSMTMGELASVVPVKADTADTEQADTAPDEPDTENDDNSEN